MGTITTSSRIRGSLYGVAVADALGGPVEFSRRGSFKPVTCYRYNHNFNLAPGTWTDDTSMTLCLAQSLVENDGKYVIRDQVRKYKEWKGRGYMSATGKCFDIGNATRQALGIWQVASEIDNDDAAAEKTEHDQELVDRALNRKVFCGNGSLMRCAPIPLVYYRQPLLAHHYAARASKPTHPHETCQQACQIYTRLIIGMFDMGLDSKPDLWNKLQPYLIKSADAGVDEGLSPELQESLGKYDSVDKFLQTDADEIKSSGYVVHTLEAALWAFFTTSTFKEGALKVVNLGDDADTVGAVYGGLAGAWYGFDAIPEEWIKGLQAKKMIDDVVEGVVKLVEKGGYDQTFDLQD